jgi:hypothetical protein
MGELRSYERAMFWAESIKHGDCVRRGFSVIGNAFSAVSRDSVVGIATGYGVDHRGVEIRVPQEFSPRRPDRLWGLPSLLSSGYRGLFPRG